MISRYALNDDVAEELEAPIVHTATAPQSEADRARAWLAGLDLDAMQKDEVCKADFFKYEVAAFRGEKVYYLFTRSPQQKTMGHRAMGTTRARGDKSDMLEGMERFIKEMEAKQARHNAQVQAKRQARSAFVNPYRVGQFLHSSWGYDQTNVEMYQIIEVRECSLKIRRVAMNSTQNGYDSGTCTPIPDRFTEAARWVTIQVYDGGYHAVPSPIHGNLYPYEGKPVSWSSGH